MRTTAELREAFLSYFEENGHLRVPSASLIPRADDHSTLLTSAGMQPQMPYFLGREDPPAPLTTTTQKVFRTPDIDEVGLDTYHLTFFEMLGNFSFGQYFKAGAIELGTEFMQERMGLDWDRVWASVRAGGTLVPLPAQNIDTGMGLERAARILQNVPSVYDTGGFQQIMDWIAAESGVAYGDSAEATKAHRILADHGRGMTFLVGDGVTPSNESRGYVLRRIIRRAIVQARRIGLPAVHPLTTVVVDQMREAYPELGERAADIERTVRVEEERFQETLERGLKVFEELAGEDAFTLAATYGFPLELTVELAGERGQPVDVDGYEAAMEEHREISRGAVEGDVQRAAEFAQAA